MKTAYQNPDFHHLANAVAGAFLLQKYTVLTLFYNYRLSLPVTTAPHLWAAGREDYVNTINGSKRSGNQQLLNKIITLYT